MAEGLEDMIGGVGGQKEIDEANAAKHVKQWEEIQQANTQLRKSDGAGLRCMCRGLARPVEEASGISLLRRHSCHVWLECISFWSFALPRRSQSFPFMKSVAGMFDAWLFCF